MNDRALKAVPAHNIELEQAILGAILVDNRAFDAIGDLRPDHLYEPLHRVVFEGAKALVEAGKVANPLTIRTMLPSDASIVGYTMAQYLALLAARATSTLMAKEYANKLRAITLIRETQGILLDLNDHDKMFTFPEDAVAQAYARLDLLRLDQPSHGVSETAAQSSKKFTQWFTGVMSGEVVEGGILTGLTDFDRMTGGLHGGNLIIMAGRPGMGKTTLATGIARAISRGGPGRQAVEANGIGGMVFSLEMSDTQQMARLHCDEAFDDDGDVITYNQALNPRRFLGVPQGERLLRAADRIEKLPLIFDYSASLTMGELAAKARSAAMSLKNKFGKSLGFIVIDYLKFIKASERYRGQRVLEVGEITGATKQLAKDLGIPIILLTQLSRAVEQTEHKVPDLSHLRDSGEIEQDADLVVFLLREAYYLQNNPKTVEDVALQTKLLECINTLTIIVAKNRHGPTGSTDVYCHMGASAIRNLHRDAGEVEMFR